MITERGGCDDMVILCQENLYISNERFKWRSQPMKRSVAEKERDALLKSHKDWMRVWIEEVEPV